MRGIDYKKLLCIIWIVYKFVTVYKMHVRSVLTFRSSYITKFVPNLDEKHRRNSRKKNAYSWTPMLSRKINIAEISLLYYRSWDMRILLPVNTKGKFSISRCLAKSCLFIFQKNSFPLPRQISSSFKGILM